MIQFRNIKQLGRNKENPKMYQEITTLEPKKKSKNS